MKNGSQVTQENGEKLNVVSIKSGPMVDEPIQFDREMTERLRKNYDGAIRHNDKDFWFEGQQLLTAYAGYLLEYLDSRLT